MFHVFAEPSQTQSDAIAQSDSETLMCYYINATSKLQIVKITTIPEFYFERVVFPGQRLLFEASPHAKLEVFSGNMASALLIDKIPCHRLQIQESLTG
ncbi:MAG: DUF1830 domain-containing protein [Elainellaceae cyanobacterium]